MFEVLNFPSSHVFTNGGNRKAQVTEFSTEKVVVDMKNADQDALLGLRVSPFPNWKVHINGEEAKVREHGWVFMACNLPEGNSNVIFQWDDTLIDTSTQILSTISWVLTLAALIFLMLREDRGLRFRRLKAEAETRIWQRSIRL